MISARLSRHRGSSNPRKSDLLVRYTFLFYDVGQSRLFPSRPSSIVFPANEWRSIAPRRITGGAAPRRRPRLNKRLISLVGPAGHKLVRTLKHLAVRWQLKSLIEAIALFNTRLPPDRLRPPASSSHRRQKR